MELEDQRRLEEHFRSLANADLRRITTLERPQHRDEAFRVAMDELARRRLAVLRPAEYWRQFQQEWLEQVGFCYQCWATTTDENLGAVAPRRLIGTRLVDEEDPCPICKSVIATKSFCIVVPIVRQAKYRVLFDRKFLPDPPKGRRLKDGIQIGQEPDLPQ
jgi:hypothetical protein